jgi:folate-dependent phosphoribosylglycinamide formyltransferase PurN
MKSSPRIALLTQHSSYAIQVAKALAEKNLRLDAAFILTGELPYRSYCSTAKSPDPTARVAGWPRSVAATLRALIRFYGGRRGIYTAVANSVIPTGLMNSRKLAADLTACNPDYIIINGGPVLCPEIIACARAGVLNSHPGLLPWIRGSSPIEHSLLNGIPLGVSLHFVNRGIDTGPIIERRLLPCEPQQVQRDDLANSLQELRTRMMIEAVKKIRDGETLSGSPQQQRFPLFRKADEKTRHQAEHLMTVGLPAELFQSWGTLCSDQVEWRLPAQFQAPATERHSTPPEATSPGF